MKAPALPVYLRRRPMAGPGMPRIAYGAQQRIDVKTEAYLK